MATSKNYKLPVVLRELEKLSGNVETRDYLDEKKQSLVVAPWLKGRDTPLELMDVHTA